MRISPIVSLGHLLQVAAMVCGLGGGIALCALFQPRDSSAPARLAAAAHPKPHEHFGPPVPWVAAQIAE